MWNAWAMKARTKACYGKLREYNTRYHCYHLVGSHKKVHDLNSKFRVQSNKIQMRC